mmetsp:Transcript_768/g.1831  ORF Transcript_768/g.1831 Transcript_768/m.1831 type:complete len:332 (+) Transcript_768:172-1167(+)
MRRSGSTNGDVTVASVEMNAMHADRDEVKEAEDTGMRALGYGGRPDDEPLPACHATATTRIVAAVCYVLATFLMFCLIETTRNYDDKGEVVPWLVITLLCYVFVAVSDPGFADSKDIPPKDEDYVARRQKVVDFLEEGHDGSTLLPWPDWPPMRCAYCAPCKRWVYGYDHYCPLVGNAVGERNRPRFFLLLLAQTILNSKAAFTMEEAVAWRDVSGGRERALVLFLVLALLFVVSFCFLVFHAFLALTNMTTHEFLKADSLDYLHNTEDFDLPFSRGFLGNLRVYVGQDGTWAFLRRRKWEHVKWTRPARVDRDSEDWWRNPWQNKYWSCC